MKVTTPPFKGLRARRRFRRRLWSAVLTGVLAGAAPAADDAYLQMLDQEATKVERVPTDTAVGDAAPAALPDGAPAAKSMPSREHFEALMQRQHIGTYSFYSRLPERSRQEIFLDYSAGASMETLREKIIDRYLHP